MTVIKFSPALIAAYPSIYGYMQNSYVMRAVTYFINSDYRQAVKLIDWLDDQCENPEKEIVQLANRLRGSTHDESVINVQKWVVKNIRYKSDLKKWKVLERWQTAIETLNFKSGDCEDGATLQYVLCHCIGVPADRMLLMCGTVNDISTDKTFGHCWFAYRATLYPLNWTFLDWCTYPNVYDIDLRPQFFVDTKTIHEYVPVLEGYQKVVSPYQTLWFGFNSVTSYTELKNKERTI